MFEELLNMEPEDALKHLTKQLVDEQMPRPENMTGADLVRRPALGSVGARIIKQARKDLGLGEHLDAIFQELVHFNHATVQGEAIRSRLPSEDRTRGDAEVHKIDLSGFDAVLAALEPSTIRTTAVATPSLNTSVAGRSAAPATTASSAPPPTVHTLRYLMDDYFSRAGKSTGSDNRSNIERAVKMFEDLCPDVKVLAVPDIPLPHWDQLYEFVQHIPQMRGRAGPENLVALTRKMQTKGQDYPELAAGTLNSNYLGAITRLVRHGNMRRLFSWQAPSMVITERKRATKGKSRVPFSSEEITVITSCPVYVGCASRHHRYSPGEHVFADGHIYWAPLISMHTGMRVTEIGMREASRIMSAVNASSSGRPCSFLRWVERC